MKEKNPYYVINEPYELFYKNGTTEYPVGAHTHNKAEIYLTLTELPDALLNTTVSKIPRGTLILIPPFCVHQLYHEKNVRYERYILNLDTKWLEDVVFKSLELTECLKQSAPPTLLTLSEKQLDMITETMQKVITDIPKKDLRSTAEFLNLLALIEEAVHHARSNAANSGIPVTKSQKTVSEIIAYINEHIESNISLTDIEAHFYLNKDYISRLFAKHTHTSVGHYIVIQRIAKAQEYLGEGYTVSQVSDTLGFSSYAYFFKTFKKITGISPSQYRKNLLQYTDMH